MDPELLAEAQRRGISPKSTIDPELLAEAQRRGITATPPAPSMTRRLMDYAAKEGAPIVGGTIGGTMGIPFGPAGMIGGSALGGAAGRGYQRVNEYLTGSRDPANDTAMGNAASMARSGLGMAASEVGGLQINAVLKALRPFASKVGAGGLKVMAAIPEKYGEAILSKPSIMNNAISGEQSAKAYGDFETRTGLQGLEPYLVDKFGRATASPTWLEKKVIQTAKDITAGKAVDPQDMYLASQSATRLNHMAKFGEPQAQMVASSAAIAQGKGIVDAALEKAHPGYNKLRLNEFESNAKDSLSSLLPTNKGGTTNVLRPWAGMTGGAKAGAAIGGAAGGAIGGWPGAAIGTVGGGLVGGAGGLMITSPLAYGKAIKSGAAMTPAAKFLAKYGTKAAAQAVADSGE